MQKLAACQHVFYKFMSYKRILHCISVLVALVFLAWLVVDQWGQIKQSNFSLRLDLLYASLLLLVGIFLLDAYGWHLILRSMGCQIDTALSLRIWLVSSLTRYIPGGIWSYLNRASMARDAGLNLTICGFSMYLETGFLMASSCAVGIPALMYMSGLNIHANYFLLFILVLGLMIHPKVVRIGRYLPRQFGQIFRSVPLPTVTYCLGLYVYYVVFWCLFGLTFICFVASISVIPIDLWLPIGSSLALGFFIGFVMIFVPGGIGVRESIIYLLFQSLVSPSEAVVIAVGSRLWIVVGEIISILGAVLFSQRAKQIADIKT